MDEVLPNFVFKEIVLEMIKIYFRVFLKMFLGCLVKLFPVQKLRFHISKMKLVRPKTKLRIDLLC